MNLVDKYNIPAPRYTSYPTVPFWDGKMEADNWAGFVKNAFSLYYEDGISLYIHLPFCESLCTYCACNTRITVNHKVELPYINTLINEWQLYLNLFDKKPILKEIHLGGGTPTFFAPQNLKMLIGAILKTVDVAASHEFSFEGHPSNTTEEHLKVLFELGFRRVSYGIQDFDEKVQDTINRYQTFDEVKKVVDLAKSIGYHSINFDLVYGLPYQTIASMQETISQIISLHPDRIAFYSYAHVPWLKPGQRKYSEKDLPADSYKRSLYEAGRELFLKAGLKDIGMDHFALPNDALFSSFEQGKLNRNFMGYTTTNTKLLIGLGASSISDTYDAFAQNIKTVEEYQEAVAAGYFAITRGHELNATDSMIRVAIHEIMCKHTTSLKPLLDNPDLFVLVVDRLEEIEQDGLIKMEEDKLIVTEAGMSFLRNICLCFDERYWNKVPAKQTFSTTA